MIRQQLTSLKYFFRMEHGEGEERGLGNGHTILETCEPKKGQLDALKNWLQTIYCIEWKIMDFPVISGRS